MIEFFNAAAAGATDNPGTMNPFTLFMHADIFVQAIMIGLLAASIWTWAIIISFATRIGKVDRASERFERDFRSTKDIDSFHANNAQSDLPSAKIFAAGIAEWRRSTKGGAVDREGTRARLSAAMGSVVESEIDKLAGRLNILATVGSVAPFVGLLGTVWGIMRSFTSIAASGNTSLTTVAPGIAEALFATAIGLFAAIPAVIAYNRFGHHLNRFEARLNRFADGFHATLSRELESLG